MSSTCSVISGTLLEIDINSVVFAGSNLSITITSIRNPTVTTPTNSITITTFYEDEQSVVDQLTNGLPITATEVPLQSVTISSSSLKVGSISNYTAVVQILNSLPASSSLKIKLPSSFPTSTLVFRELSI